MAPGTGAHVRPAAGRDRHLRHRRVIVRVPVRRRERVFNLGERICPRASHQTFRLSIVGIRLALFTGAKRPLRGIERRRISGADQHRRGEGDEKKRGEARHCLRSVNGSATICNRLHASRGAVAMQVKLFAAALGTLAFVFGISTTLTAQRSAADGARALEGGWVRLDTSGSGSFGGLTANFARAALTPEGAAKLKPQRDPDDVEPDNRPHKAGEPYIVTQGRCGGFGRGGVGPNSVALVISLIHI